MRRRSGRVAIILLAAGLAPEPSAASQPTVVENAAQVVDATEAERRGFKAFATDKEAAAKWFEQAAAAGRPASQWMLGQHYFDAKGEDRDVARALELIRAAAVQGLASAQSFLGWMYFNGTDVKRDLAESFAWFSAAARQEDTYALLMLSGFYGTGEVVKQDPALAKRLLVRSAELGNIDAVRAIFVQMLYGAAELRDSPLAIHFLTKAAKAKDAWATYTLAREYLRGANVQPDPATAAQWLQRSADAGNALASLWLSELHFKGFGVARDPKRAEQLLSDALPKASMREKNQFAWELSVNKDERLRDGTLAVRVLEPALQAVTEKVTAHVDTLAAAYAEVRQFDRAVTTQMSAIDRAKRERRPEEMISGMTDRLRLYEVGKPYREEAP